MSTVAEDVTKQEAEGRVVAIAGPVVDVEFPPGRPARDQLMPSTWRSMSTAKRSTITAEVAQQIGEGRVRCICLQANRRTPPGNRGHQHRAGVSPCRSATPSWATCST